MPYHISYLKACAIAFALTLSFSAMSFEVEEHMDIMKQEATYSEALREPGRRLVTSDPPCFPAHDDVKQNHVAPRAPRLAVLVMFWSDVSEPSAEEVVAYYNDEAVQKYLRTISSGCLHVELVPFSVKLSVTEKTPDKSCRDVFNDQVELPSIPGWLHNGAVQSEFWSTAMIQVGKTCVYSASTGSRKVVVDGASIQVSGIGMGHTLKFAQNYQKNDVLERNGFKTYQTSWIHELLHLLGMGYHHGAYQCLNPKDEGDILACPKSEYGDEYDILGGTGYLTCFNARGRYNMGWLGRDNITVIRVSGSYTMNPINSADGVVAAVIAGKDVWFEWRTKSDANEIASAISLNPGLFVRHHQNLIDASLQTCDSKDDDEWVDDDESGIVTTTWKIEMRRVTLEPGRVLILRDLNILIGDVSTTSSVMHFSVYYSGAELPCERREPDIAVGLFGEWGYVGGSSYFGGYSGGVREQIRILKSSPELSKYSRFTVHSVNALMDRDAAVCTRSTFTIALHSGLPPNWAFKASKPRAIKPGKGETHFIFAFGIPSEAADGNYDFCISATSSNGLRTAKIFRLSLPEESLEWYTNNRPSDYKNVDASLLEACKSVHGCTEESVSCHEPAQACDVDLPCAPSAWAEWGTGCWDFGSSALRTRGKDFCSVRQSFCRLHTPDGNDQLLDQRSCRDPSAMPCLDQKTCRVEPNGWEELKIGQSSGLCNNGRGGLCNTNGVGYGKPVCEQTYSSGELKESSPCYNDGWNVKCIRALCEGSELCGGYQTNSDGSTYWLIGIDIGVEYANANYQCWAKPTISVGPSSYEELKIGQSSGLCNNGRGYLCKTNGVGYGKPVCEQTYSSGDFDYRHPCYNDGWNVKCIRALCDGSELCGGYQTEADGSTYWLVGVDIGVKHANAKYQCWAKTLSPGLQTCTCNGGQSDANSYRCPLPPTQVFFM